MLNERNIRRQLNRLGYTLCKTPSRHWTRKYYGAGYMVVRNNTVVMGCGGREYEATLQEVRNWLDAHSSQHEYRLIDLNIREHSTYYEDQFGNKCEFEFFEGKERALLALQGLVGCQNCFNCEDCVDCSDCRYCYLSEDCTDCVGCFGCIDCHGCGDCEDCTDCHDCEECRECMGCQFCVSEEFAKLKEDISAFRKMRLGITSSDGIESVCQDCSRLH